MSAESVALPTRKPRALGRARASLRGEVPLWVVIAVSLAVCLFPIYWMASASLKPGLLTFAIPPAWVWAPTLENYRNLLGKVAFGRYVVNTLIVASVTTVLAITFGSLAAYAFTRFRFPGATAIPLFYLVMRMVPRIVIVLPYYVIMSELGLLDTYTSLILAYTTFALPFVIWMMIGFFQDIPVDLEEAASVDGCNRLGVLRHIVVPLAAPGLAATSVFAFLLGWNEFLFSLILTSSSATRTLPVVVAGFVTDRGVAWGEMSAGGVLIALPVIIFALLVQKYIVRGLTMGAVKG